MYKLLDADILILEYIQEHPNITIDNLQKHFDNDEFIIQKITIFEQNSLIEQQSSNTEGGIERPNGKYKIACLGDNLIRRFRENQISKKLKPAINFKYSFSEPYYGNQVESKYRF